MPPAGSVRNLAFVVLGLLLLWTSYYQVEPAEVGVVQRFGRLVRITDPGPAPQDPVRDREGDEGAGAAPAQHGVRLPHPAPGRPHRVRRAHPGNRRRVGDAHRRPERGGGGVDRPVPDQGRQGLPLPRARRPRDLPPHVRGRHAPGGGGPQRGRGASPSAARRSRARRRKSCSGSASSTAWASRSSSSSCRT